MENLQIREPQLGLLDKRGCILQVTACRWSNILQSFQRSWVVNIYRNVITILLSLACTFDRLSVCQFVTLTRPLDPNKFWNGDFCLLYYIAAVSLIPSQSHLGAVRLQLTLSRVRYLDLTKKLHFVKCCYYSKSKNPSCGWEILP